MRSQQTLTIKGELSSLSITNILDIFRYHRTSMIKEPSARRLKIDTLMQSASPISRKLVIEWLNSPDIEKRARAFRALMRHPYPEAFKAVLSEATNATSPLQTEAITTLGILKNKAAYTPLQNILESSNATTQTYIIKTLLRLDGDIDDNTIKNIYWDAAYPGNRLQILLGISETKRKELCINILTEELTKHPATAWTETLILYTAQAFNIKETLVDILKEEKAEPGAGLEYILEESDEDILAKLDTEAIKTAFNTKQYQDLYKTEKHPATDSILQYSFDSSSFLGLLLLWIIQQERIENSDS